MTAESVAKDLVGAVLHLHADHDAYGVLEGEGEEEVRLGELAAEDEDPEHDAREAGLLVELGVRGGERLAGEVLARLACYSVAEESAGGDHREDDNGEHRDAELDDADDECDVGGLVEGGDPDGRTTGEGEDDEEEDEAGHEVRGVVPGGGDVAELGEGGGEHDEGGDGSSKSDGGPLHWRVRVLRVARGVDVGAVVGLPKRQAVSMSSSATVWEALSVPCTSRRWKCEGPRYG